MQDPGHDAHATHTDVARNLRHLDGADTHGGNGRAGCLQPLPAPAFCCHKGIRVVGIGRRPAAAVRLPCAQPTVHAGTGTQRAGHQRVHRPGPRRPAEQQRPATQSCHAERGALRFAGAALPAHGPFGHPHHRPRLRVTRGHANALLPIFMELQEFRSCRSCRSSGVQTIVIWQLTRW